LHEKTNFYFAQLLYDLLLFQILGCFFIIILFLLLPNC